MNLLVPIFLEKQLNVLFCEIAFTCSVNPLKQGDRRKGLILFVFHLGNYKFLFVREQTK